MQSKMVSIPTRWAAPEYPRPQMASWGARQFTAPK